MQVEKIPTDGKTLAKEREGDISGSVMGALVGPHPYATPLKLNAKHRLGTAFAPLDPESKILKRGRWGEAAAARAVGEAHPEWRIEPAKCYLRAPELRLGAHPDFFIHDDLRGLGVLETKTAGQKAYDDDYEGGTAVPLWILLQVTTQMMLSDAAFGVVGVLLWEPYDTDIAIHQIPRNKAVEQKIVQVVKQFWDDVANGREPAPDFQRDAETIRAMLPREVAGKIIDMSGNNMVPVLLEERAAIADAVKIAEARKDAIDAELKYAMGDAEKAIGIPGWGMTFRSVHRAGYTVEPKTVRSLRVTDRREKQS